MTLDLRLDVRSALRGLRRGGSATLVAILTLAIGIGVVTAAFAVIDAVVFRPLVPGQERVVRVWKQDVQRGAFPLPLSFPELSAWRDQIVRARSSFSATAVFDPSAPWTLAIGTQDISVPATVSLVSASFFDVVYPRGVPVSGRWFLPDEDRPGVDIPVVVSERFQRRLGPAAAVGRRLTMSGARTLTVVGVAPVDVDYPLGTDVWAPLARVHDGGEGRFDAANRKLALFHLVGRLAADTRLDAARTELEVVQRRVVAAYPGDYQHRPIVIEPLIDTVVGNSRRVLVILLAAAALVFIIAGVNVAALQLMRASARTHELAIRSALGAGLAQLVRQSLVESALLAGVGAIAGAAIAAVLVAVVRGIAPFDLPRVADAGIDARGLAVCAGGAAVWIVVFGTLPLWTRGRLGASAAAGHGERTARGTRGLVVFTMVEVAAALVVTVMSGLLLQSFAQLNRVGRGFDSRNLLLATVLLPEARVKDPQTTLRLFEDLLPRLRETAGVSAVSPINIAPGSGSVGLSAPMLFEGQTESDAKANPWATWEPILPEYFQTLGIPIVQGRAFSDADRADSAQVAIVSEATAQRYWPGQDPIGRRLKLVDEDQFQWVTVVGVAGDTRYRELTQGWLTVYFPARQFFFFRPSAIAIRTTGSPEAVAPLVRERLRQVDAGAALASVTTMEALLARELSRPLTALTVTGVFALTAAILAVVGVYGVFAFEVRQRRRELAVRSAIGATPATLLVMVVRRGVAVGAGGVALGLVAAGAGTRALAPLLYGVGTRDATTMIAGGVVLLVLATLAALIPARAAAAVDPVVALRQD